MEEVRPWCGQPSDREQLYDRTEQIIKSQCVVVCVTMKTNNNDRLTALDPGQPG